MLLLPAYQITYDLSSAYSVWPLRIIIVFIFFLPVRLCYCIISVTVLFFVNLLPKDMLFSLPSIAIVSARSYLHVL